MLSTCLWLKEERVMLINALTDNDGRILPVMHVERGKLRFIALSPFCLKLVTDVLMHHLV